MKMFRNTNIIMAGWIKKRSGKWKGERGGVEKV